VPDHPVHPAAELQADLRQLGGLPGAGLAGDDHDLGVPDGGQDLVLVLADRQRRRVADRRHARPPASDALGGSLVAPVD
jgi:hypothetical protein